MSLNILSTIRNVGSTTSFYPLRNTAVDPTNATWRNNNPGYTFTPNVGITTIGPMTNASQMFRSNFTFNDPDISLWDTSTFTNMAGMFALCNAFNQSISNFVTNRVTIMNSMFFGCSRFNQSVSNFDTTSVTSMSSMFDSCIIFNQSVSNFNTANVINMDYMFFDCAAFNQSVSNFNTANVISMNSMFYRCTSFNQSVANFNTANVINMNSMFFDCDDFNQSVANFDTTNVINMNSMFSACSVFNCGLATGVAHDLMQRTASGGWRTNRVTSDGMNGMFQDALSFNGNISSWCVSNIRTSPVTFAIGANPAFTTARQPQWGTCPIP